jgi:hypothetical protein
VASGRLGRERRNCSKVWPGSGWFASQSWGPGAGNGSKASSRGSKARRMSSESPDVGPIARRHSLGGGGTKRVRAPPFLDEARAAMRYKRTSRRASQWPAIPVLPPSKPTPSLLGRPRIASARWVRPRRTCSSTAAIVGYPTPTRPSLRRSSSPRNAKVDIRAMCVIHIARLASRDVFSFLFSLPPPHFEPLHLCSATRGAGLLACVRPNFWRERCARAIARASAR